MRELFRNPTIRRALLASVLLLSGSVMASTVDHEPLNDLPIRPQCGGQPCAIIAKPVRLVDANKHAATTVYTGPGVVLGVPAGYMEITHNGAVDIFKYPGHKALSLHETSIAAFGDLGASPRWYISRNNDVVTFFHREADHDKWRAFLEVTRTPTPSLPLDGNKLPGHPPQACH